MKKIVRGNDFTLRIPICKIVNGEQVAFPLPACTDIVVNIVNQYRRVALSYAIDTTEDNILNARVEGDAVSVGTYALEVRGKIFGNDWRSKEYEQFAIVDNNASGDTAFNGELIEGEDSVEMNTALVILPPTAELTQLITDANTAIETAKQTDATLKANESERTEAEQQRASAEVARVSAENKRSESEGVRHAAEVERVSNEDARKATEVQRANAEVGRVEAERVRTANETARVAAEKQRATTFAELSVNIDAAVSKANSAASAANTATDKANAEEGKRAEAENLRADAEATRKQNENTRLGAETERVRQETAREAAESVRQTAEAERAGNESARKVSESDRVAAEQQRVSAETERMSNEDARKTAESERVNGETARQTAENEREADEQERKTNETERKTAETQRKKAEETRIAAEASRVSAEEQREATLATTKANCEAATKKASDAASEATLATSKANSSAEKANAAVVAAENVDATLANDVLTVTNRKGESTSLQLARYAEVGDVVSEVKHLSETMGAYTDRPDIVLTAKETNKAISASGAKVNKSGWAIAEFTAEKGNVYLFKPNVIDESVCIFAEYIQSVETRGIDYTYTYNSDGTTATATATYLGATHTYTYTYAEDKSFAITDETGAAVDALPMVYETKVGTYSPLVSLNADAELPKDGYCRYMSHFKGNSAIKVVVSYKVGVADLTMKVTRDGVLASVSTQLGNLSQMEDETRKKIDELHGNWVDVLFLADTTVYVDYKAVIIKGKTRTRLYPKQQLQFGGKQYGSFIPLLWADLSHLTSAIRLSYFKEGNAQGLFQGCNKISSLTLNNLGISKNVTLKRMFSGCSSLQSLNIEGWDVSKVTDMYGMFASCSSLQSLNIEGWDVSKVTDMYGMFSGCSSLQSLNIEGWDVSKVTDMYGMFASCSSLQSLNIEGWDVSKVASMNQIFYGCSSLRSLDLSGWNLESCKNIDYLGQYNFIPKTLKLGTGFFKCPATKASLYFTTWTDASVKESLVVNSYDRKANGLPDFTLTLSKQTKAVLSEDDIAAMTAKGYIIA
jgi:surface protein